MTDHSTWEPDSSARNAAVLPFTGRPDKEVAEELKARVIATIEPMLVLFTEAKKEGFEVAYSIQMDGLGKAYLHTLKIMKEY